MCGGKFNSSLATCEVSSSFVNHFKLTISKPSGLATSGFSVKASNANIIEFGNGHGCENKYLTSLTSRPVSSLTSLTTASSRDSPGSTKPAKFEKRFSGQIDWRPKHNLPFRSWTATIIAGSVLGKGAGASGDQEENEAQDEADGARGVVSAGVGVFSGL